MRLAGTRSGPARVSLAMGGSRQASRTGASSSPFWLAVCIAMSGQPAYRRSKLQMARPCAVACAAGRDFPRLLPEPEPAPGISQLQTQGKPA